MKAHYTREDLAILVQTLTHELAVIIEMTLDRAEAQHVFPAGLDALAQGLAVTADFGLPPSDAALKVVAWGRRQ